MRTSTCTQCGGTIVEDDSNPAVHYSSPETICYHCRRAHSAPVGTWLQRKDGSYYQKQ